MASANIAIINEIKKFSEEIAENPQKREEYVFSSKDFCRKRLLCFKTIILLITNTLKRSLSIEINDFFEYFSKGTTCSKQAFSKRRRKLKPEFFYYWNEKLTESFYLEYGEKSARWKGFTLLAVDGSTMSLPPTEEVKEMYGCTTNQRGEGASIARVCVLYDVLNNVAIKGLLHSYSTSEISVVSDILKDRDLKDKLILFDRGYFSYKLTYQLLGKNTHFVMRVSCNANNAVKEFLASDEIDQTLNIYPNHESWKIMQKEGLNITKETPVRIRMVKVLLDTGEIEVLITNLYDLDVYTIEDLKVVYYLRWAIETYYGYIKEELQLEQFSGINLICIEQDFAANLFLFNLQSIIEKQCEPIVETISMKRKYKYKVNKNISWASLKYRVVKLFIENEPTDILMELEQLFCRYLEPIRPGRKYPRIKKRKPNSKYHTLTNYKRAI